MRRTCSRARPAAARTSPGVSEAAGRDELLLLDTHVWVWAVLGETARVGREVPNLISAAVQTRRVRVSAVSVWEAGRAITRGRLPIRGTWDEWLSFAVAAYGGTIYPVDRAVAAASVQLPALDHGDPADRLLIATARLMGARLATADEKIIAYGELGHVDVLDVRR